MNMRSLSLRWQLSAELRAVFERAVSQARMIADSALTLEMGRQFDDPAVEANIFAYWQQLLLIRCFAECGLLLDQRGRTLAWIEDLSFIADRNTIDGWLPAVRSAALLLPGFFDPSDPLHGRLLPPAARMQLSRIVCDLPSELFQAVDALGWGYQFWQSRKKERANKDGRKIDATTLAPMTQLFTEPYMMRFLLENTLGAWWMSRHPDSQLRGQLAYLRWSDGVPAAGCFNNWPARVAEITVMDPCCGAGHMLLGAFDLLCRMRMEEEGLSAAEAADAVLHENLFGLELDPRCAQLAAITLALASWSLGGRRRISAPNITCVGLPPAEPLQRHMSAGNLNESAEAIRQLYEILQQAPLLGSLIRPSVPLLSLLERLEEASISDPIGALFGTPAGGLAHTAGLLSGRYTLVATNVPYLARGKQSAALTRFCDEHYPHSKTDLATVFLERCRAFCSSGGSYALVTPHNWLFLGSYQRLREVMLQEQTWAMVARLGEGGFVSNAAAGAFSALCIFHQQPPALQHTLIVIDASSPRTVREKSTLLQQGLLHGLRQSELLQSPHAALSTGEASRSAPLGTYARLYEGMKPGQTSRVTRMFWEVIDYRRWVWLSSSPAGSVPYSGNAEVILRPDLLRVDGIDEANTSGAAAWGQHGVLIAKMRNLSAALYLGAIYDNNTFCIVPKDAALLPAIWAFVSSDEFTRQVRAINQKLDVALSSVAAVGFDQEHWRAVAAARGPLPAPASHDPTQWLFAGHPRETSAPLHVAVARLLGFRWPFQQPDSLDCHSVGPIICWEGADGLAAAAERMRALLADAYQDGWSSDWERQLLGGVGYGRSCLERWLRDGFFKQHCALFRNRPFIWHIWDGRKDGFAALVNYQHFDAQLLHQLIENHLAGWIAGLQEGDERLVAALALRDKLLAIQAGEPPYDIYVRWKPLDRQPIGWDPDLDDGVRVNIRPFVMAGILRCRFAINWNKDRGLNPDGSARRNDLHLTGQQKRQAR